MVLYYLLGHDTIFLASTLSENSKIIDHIKKFVPLIAFARGIKDKKINIVDEMRKIVDTKGSICIFPEGMMKHPDALIKFRTGAFNIGRPVFAIVIRYNDIVTDGYINNFLYKLGTKKDLYIEVHFMGPYYPPFDNSAIEKIRTDMARCGKMCISRVSNRDIVDTNPT